MITTVEADHESLQLVPKARAAEEARALYRTRRHGVLSTASKKHEGWPFASVTPYGPDADGRPLLYIAGIAEHTRNLGFDPRCSLFVQPPIPEGTDAQTFSRLTLMGRAERVPAAEVDDAFARYVARLPDARGYTKAHDFGLWRIVPERARFIGGFGKIFWLDPQVFLAPMAQDPLREAAPGAIAHMNEDHVDAMELCCKSLYGVEAKGVRMVGLDQYGFDVVAEAPDRRFRFDFPEPATPDTLRMAVVEVVKAARA